MPDCIRITIGLPEENERLVKTLARVRGKRVTLDRGRGGRPRLLGGSVALAARQRGAAREVVGATRSSDARAQALADGAVDRIAPLAEGRARRGPGRARDAGWARWCRRCARWSPGLAPGCVITDVGSVKGAARRDAAGPPCPRAAPTSARTRWRAAITAACRTRARTSSSARSASSPRRADPAAGARVVAFWEALGARVVRRSAAQHDARSPGSAICPICSRSRSGAPWPRRRPPPAELAGRRIPGLHPDRAQRRRALGRHPDANRKALAAPLRAAGAQLEAIARALEAGDAEGLDRLLSAARTALFPAPPASESFFTDVARSRGDRSKGDPDQRL
jgi:hypothetical protein